MTPPEPTPLIPTPSDFTAIYTEAHGVYCDTLSQYAEESRHPRTDAIPDPHTKALRAAGKIIARELERETVRLAAERDGLKTLHADMLDQHARVVQEREALAARVKELEADERRLNWMVQTQGTNAWSGYGLVFRIQADLLDHDLRGAIDAALASGQEGT